MENYYIPKVAEPFLLDWSIIESLSQCYKGERLHRTNKHIYFLLRKISIKLVQNSSSSYILFCSRDGKEKNTSFNTRTMLCEK